MYTSDIERLVHLSARGEHARAVKGALRLVDSLERLDCASVLGLAAVLAFGARPDAAIRLYDHILVDDPGNLEATRGRAMALRFNGDIAAAETAFDEHLELDPRDYESQFLRSSLRVQTSERNHVDMLEQLLDGEVASWQEASVLAFALSKELHDLGRYDAAWFHLSMGAKIKRRHLNYDVARDEAAMTAIRDAFASGFDRRGLASADVGKVAPAPLFIVGLPRSGSTLVERMLSSHPSAESVGESAAFPNLLEELQGMMGSLDHPVARASLARLDAEHLGRRYLETIGADDYNCRYLIDKLPINFRHVGLIRLALPTARIIDVRRSPVSSCFAMFRHLFSDAYPFSYDLAECARYYAAYQALMEHWDRVLPGYVMRVEYETFVTNFRREAARIISALDLEWHDDCLNFSANVKPSLTASAAQVRQNLYKTAINSWLPYRTKLTPLLDALSRAGVKSGKGPGGGSPKLEER